MTGQIISPSAATTTIADVTDAARQTNATSDLTRGSAIAEGPRDAPRQLKPCQLLRAQLYKYRILKGFKVIHLQGKWS